MIASCLEFIFKPRLTVDSLVRLTKDGKNYGGKLYDKISYEAKNSRKRLLDLGLDEEAPAKRQKTVN